jgi:hypothetical protein
MPVKVFEFTPTALNLSNDQSASSFVNTRTLQPVNAGGLCLGDAIDLTNFEAAGLSAPTIGLLYQGRYRRVQVDANATAANVAKGKAAFVVPGYSVMGVLLATAGTGQTAGTYQVAGTGGGGSGAIIQVVVATGGTVTAQPVLIAGGSGYTSAPTFTLAAGGTPATFQAQMAVNSNIVTSSDVTGVNLSQGRGVFLNTITPGNYGWIQEFGIATVLQTGTVTSATVGAIATPVSSAGTFQSTVATAAPAVTAFGTTIDAAIANAYYRVQLSLIPYWAG